MEENDGIGYYVNFVDDIGIFIKDYNSYCKFKIYLEDERYNMKINTDKTNIVQLYHQPKNIISINIKLFD